MRLHIILIATLLAPMACDDGTAKPAVSDRSDTPTVAPGALMNEPQDEQPVADEAAVDEPYVEESVTEEPVAEEPVVEAPVVVEQPPAPEPEYRPSKAGPIDNLGQGAGNDISDMDGQRGNSISEMDAPRGNSISEIDGGSNSVSEMDTPRGNSISEMTTEQLPPIDGRDPITREPTTR